MANLQMSEHGQLVSDAYNYYNTMKDYADTIYNREYTAWADSIEQALKNESLQYTKDRDAIEDSRYLAENDWNGDGKVDTKDQIYYNKYVKSSDNGGQTKLSNGEDANKMSTYKQKAWEKYAESEASGDAYVDALGLSDEEEDEIYAYVDEHSTSSEEIVRGKASNSGNVSSFKTDEGDNFDVSVNGTNYRVENKGKVTDADMVEKLNKVKVENGDVFLHDGDAYVKFANGYYKVGATNIFMFKTSGYQDLLAALQQ
jgi:hypothetical protein